VATITTYTVGTSPMRRLLLAALCLVAAVALAAGAAAESALLPVLIHLVDWARMMFHHR
jgi:hypothetical protein